MDTEIAGLRNIVMKFYPKRFRQEKLGDEVVLKLARILLWERYWAQEREHRA